MQDIKIERDPGNILDQRNIPGIEVIQQIENIRKIKNIKEIENIKERAVILEIENIKPKAWTTNKNVQKERMKKRKE